MAPASDASSARRHLGERLVSRLDGGALAFGLLFWAASLLPSLLPRENLVQGAISAVSLLVGYGLAGLVLEALRAIGRRRGWHRPRDSWRRIGTIAVVVSAALIATLGSWAWLAWQNAQREMLGMPTISWRSPLNVLVVGLVVGALLLAVSRLVAGGCGWIFAALRPRIGSKASRLVVGLVVVLVAALSFEGLIVKGIFASTESSYASDNATTDPGIQQPTSPLQSGGPGSLVAWSSLGLQGRTFAGSATSKAHLQRFAGSEATVEEPIRVYVGLDSAESPKARARLAVEELDRTGAFDRPVLVVATATGTGWVDPVAASAIEYLWKGDSAIVSMQYSYLPSWIAFLTERATAAEAGRALMDAVAQRWRQLPVDHRPRLVIFGESLGSYGAEAGLVKADLPASMESLFAHGEAALFTGPTNTNGIWRQLNAARSPKSPIWRPVVPGQPVTWANDFQEIASAPPKPLPRVQYVQHASDPVTWWDWSTLWWPPAFITGPHGPDVPRAMSWWPVVTWLQNTSDLMAGFSATVGHGHNYNDAFAGGFASVAAPPGWTQADTDRLAKLLTVLNVIGSGS